MKAITMKSIVAHHIFHRQIKTAAVVILVGLFFMLPIIGPQRTQDIESHSVSGTVMSCDTKLGYLILEHEGQNRIYRLKRQVMENLVNGGIEGRQMIIHYHRKFGCNCITHLRFQGASNSGSLIRSYKMPA